MDVQDCIREVLKISSDVNNASESEVLRSLLKLQRLLDCQSLDASEVRRVKKQIWRSDLIHVIVEILRQDFSLMRGEWDAAAQLALILSNVCAGLKPRFQKATPGDQSTRLSTAEAVAETEQIKEYYDILLPTAVDSLLILANSLLESVVSTAENRSANSGFENLTHFQSILDALNWLCAGHKQCIPRAIQSPYLLHLLITDDSDYCQVVIAALKKLLAGDGVDKSVVAGLPEEVVQGILDEVVYKLSGNDQNVAVPALKLLASFVGYSPSLLQMILSRYPGLLIVASKWRSLDLGTDVEHLFSQLESASGGHTGTEVANRAAIVIQATWKGYSTRMKVEKMRRGIRRFQQLYRRRKAEKVKLEHEESRKKTVRNAKRIMTHSSLRSFHEKQMTIVTQLPASEVESFLQKQKSQAAIKIQSWWRTKIAGKVYRSQKHQVKRTASAIVIQRTYRAFIKQKKDSVELRKALPPYPEIKGQERETIQREIAQYRELHPPARKSEEQLRLLHEDVQGLLEEFYSKRHLNSRREERQRSLLSQLDRDCKLLMSAPSLAESTPETVRTFSSGSVNVARMAQTAHREELKAMELPWWKRPLSDVEISL